HDRREPVEIGRLTDEGGLGADAREHARVQREPALHGENADLHQPRLARRSAGASTSAASCQCVVARTMARARAGGSSDLKMPDPTKTDSAPSAMQSAASAGV